MAQHTTPKAYIEFWKEKFQSFRRQYSEKRSTLIDEILEIITNRDNDSQHKHALTLQDKLNVLLSNNHNQLNRWRPWFKFSFDLFGLLPRTYTITFGGSDLYAMIYREHSNNSYAFNLNDTELSQLDHSPCPGKNDEEFIQFQSHDEIIKEMTELALKENLENVLKKLTQHSHNHGLSPLPADSLTDREFHTATFCLLEKPTQTSIVDSCRFLQLHRDEFTEANFFAHFNKLCETDFDGCFDFFIGQIKTDSLEEHLGSKYQQRIIDFFSTTIEDHPLSPSNTTQYCRLCLLNLDDMSVDEVTDLLAELSTNQQIAKQAFIAMATNGLINKAILSENQLLLLSFMADYLLNHHILNKPHVNQIAYSSANLLLLLLSQKSIPSSTWQELIGNGFNTLPESILKSMQEQLKQKMCHDNFTNLIEGRNNASGLRTNAFNTPTVLLKHVGIEKLYERSSFVNLLIHRLFVSLLTTIRYKYLDFPQNWSSTNNHTMYAYINVLRQLSGQSHVKENDYASLINAHQGYYILSVMQHRRNEENIAAQVMLAYEKRNELKELCINRDRIECFDKKVDWDWVEHRMQTFWQTMPNFSRKDQINRHRLNFEIGKHRHFINQKELKKMKEFDTLPTLKSIESNTEKLLKFTQEQTCQTYASQAGNELELARIAVAAFNQLLSNTSYAYKLYKKDPDSSVLGSNLYTFCDKLEVYVTKQVYEQWITILRRLDTKFDNNRPPAKVSQLSTFKAVEQFACRQHKPARASKSY